jgi:hypothetical protein
MCENCTRREFLGRTMMGSLLLTSAGTAGVIAASPARSMSWPWKVPICVLFAGDPVPPDRGWGVSEPEIASMERDLAAVERKLGNVEFVIGRVRSAEEAAAMMERAGAEAPVLAVSVSIGGLLRVAAPILESGRPLAVFSPPASGHDWMYPFRWREEGRPVTLFTSSDPAELERAARLLRVVPLMRHSRVLVFEPFRGTTAACSPEAVKNRLGVEVVVVPQQRFDRMLDEVDARAAEEETEVWLRDAERTIEPTREDVRKAARVSVVLERLLEEEKAQGLAERIWRGWGAGGFAARPVGRNTRRSDRTRDDSLHFPSRDRRVISLGGGVCPRLDKGTDPQREVAGAEEEENRLCQCGRRAGHFATRQKRRQLRQSHGSADNAE